MSLVLETSPIQRLHLSAVPWAKYGDFLHAFEGRHYRLTFDRGELEIATVFPGRERRRKLAARLLETLTVELELEVAGYGNTTFRREDVQRGLEFDDCWYIANAIQMRGRDQIDLDVDPVPDLALEIEITRSILDRIEIAERIRVPELWRYDGVALTFLALNAVGEYETVEESLSFPGLQPGDLLLFLNRDEAESENAILRAFRQWIRDNLTDA